MTEFTGPPEFAALPDDVRRAYLTQIGQTRDYAYDHAVPLVIAKPAHSGARGSLRSASGFFAQINGRYYLGTADHVWRAFLERTVDGQDVIFQVGSLRILPDRPGVYRDPARDIAFIPVLESEARRSARIISSTPRGWPPPRPIEGSYVVFSGCPEVLRDHVDDSRLEFGAFSSIMRVTSASEEHIVCQFEREIWISDYRKAPPPGTDLSGMSGGPVFSLADPLSMPLVGLIYEFSSDLELLYIRTFSNVLLP